MERMSVMLGVHMPSTEEHLRAFKKLQHYKFVGQLNDAHLKDTAKSFPKGSNTEYNARMAKVEEAISGVQKDVKAILLALSGSGHVKGATTTGRAGLCL